MRAITPDDQEASIRLPAGHGRTFRRIYPRIHTAERVTVAPPDGS